MCYVRVGTRGAVGCHAGTPGGVGDVAAMPIDTTTAVR